MAFKQPLAKAYWMKEQLRMFCEQPNKKNAKLYLEEWCDWAWNSGIRILIEMANTMALHQTKYALVG